uniref:DUF3453 domain-containing protein n=1 Tax=Macrostomum lignano TaxID=282301 RepID=A0A1I8F2F1_9PLAT
LPFPSSIGSQSEFAFNWGIPTAEPELVADPGGATKAPSDSVDAATVSLARLTVDALLRLSDAPLLPYDCESLARVATACHNWAAGRLRLAVAARRCANFSDALRNFAARMSNSRLDTGVSELNEQLGLLSRSFQDDGGGGNLLMGSGPTGVSRCFPQLSQALTAGRRFATKSAAAKLITAFRQATAVLNGGLGGGRRGEERGTELRAKVLLIEFNFDSSTDSDSELRKFEAPIAKPLKRSQL